jgi:leader peptidase (prepilin peptidase) / N-methyltransferase
MALPFLIACAYGVFGLIIGSFLNVVILRKNLHSLGGRSECMSCETTLRWYELIPVFSWLGLRGRCGTCGSAISVQYPLVEAATGILFALVGWSYIALEPLTALIALAIISTLVAIAAYDIRHTIIPDTWAYLFAALALLYTFTVGIPTESSILLYVLAGPLAALPISTLWFISGGQWIGLGDAKLSLGMGWLLGPVYGIMSVFFAFVIGAVISVCILMPLPALLRFLSKKGIARFRGGGAQLTMKSEVPFGPFLIASCVIVWFSLLYNIPLPF